jgi:hypothetical protein
VVIALASRPLLVVRNPPGVRFCEFMEYIHRYIQFLIKKALFCVYVDISIF